MTQDLFSLEGRVALVTGGNGGLGRAMALGMRAAGAQVVVTGRNPERNKAIIGELGDPQALFSLDVRDEEAVEETMSEVVARFGRLDILVNNAGAWHSAPLLDMTQDDWDAIVGVNLTGSFLCARHAAKVMIPQNTGGKIINIGSLYSIIGGSETASYASSKAGVLGLTRALAVELATHQIQVNAILPGYHWTGITSVAKGTPWEEEKRRQTPAGRVGNAEDVVGAAIFLAAAASDFVTGAAIPVDGGFSMTREIRAEG
jgi:2-deoxy-D-gluconate 3-dehydrogenase